MSRFKIGKLQNELDHLGLITAIDRINRKQFVVYVNGEAKKSYKQRRSCNSYLKRLFTNSKGHDHHQN